MGPTPDAIAKAEKNDPQSPGALDARLEYADYLAGAKAGSCAERLDKAQWQLDTLAANPAFQILLALGPARMAAIEHRIHFGRASCANDTKQRESELGEALAAAQRAVGLYRDALDYKSMAIMQFNVAVAQRELGNNDAGAAALESAIEMDREYGFHDDAQENEQVLALWNGQKAAGDQPKAGAPQKLAGQSAAVKFAWAPKDADVDIEMSFSRIIDGKSTHTEAMRTARRHVREANARWLVTYEAGAIVERAIAGLDETGLLRGLTIPFARGLLELAPIQLTEQGEFDQVIDGRAIAIRLQAEAQTLLREHSAAGREPSPEEARALEVTFAPEVVEARAEEDYNLETGAWNGATMERGVWYQTSAPLMLPGIIQVAVPHDVEFAYTHQVPCVAGATERACIEIVVHASPRAEDLEKALKAATHALHLRPGLKYWSATYMRIITDPSTLTPYLRDTRRYWHIAGPHASDTENASERIVSRSTDPSG
jgi:hypothetical protein